MATLRIDGRLGKPISGLVALPGGGFSAIFAEVDGVNTINVDLRLFELPGGETASQSGGAINIDVTGRLTIPRPPPGRVAELSCGRKSGISARRQSWKR